MPATRPYPLYLALGACMAAAVAAWVGLVPRFLSGSTLAGVTVVAVALCAVILMSLRDSGSTESVAHVLHDAETAVDASRKVVRR
jgi:uncharacterized 2Fe-2S/4Fe-4S cluster protein (DUF4445 family)